MASEVPPGNVVGRESWGRRIEYGFSLFLSTNAFQSWAIFPYLCYRNGGATFVFIYLVCWILFGFPAVYMESLMGQMGQTTPHRLFRHISPLAVGIGLAQTICIGMALTQWIGVTSSSLYYMGRVSSLDTITSCDNHWNTRDCKESVGYEYYNMTWTSKTAPEEFWENYVWNKSVDLGYSAANPNIHLWIASFFACLLAWAIISRGILSFGKASIGAGILYIILLITLTGRSVSLPGTSGGLAYMFQPSAHRFAHPDAWFEALGHIIYEWNLGLGINPTLASYNKKKSYVFWDVTVVAAISIVHKIWVTIVMGSFFGFLATHLGQSMDEIMSNGMNTVVHTMPFVFSALPAGGFFFFVFLALDCIPKIFNSAAMLQYLSSAFVDQFSKLRGWKGTIVLNTTLSAIIFLFSLCYTGPAGQELLALSGSSLSLTIRFIFVAQCLAFCFFYCPPRLFKKIGEIYRNGCMGSFLRIISYVNYPSWALLCPLIAIFMFLRDAFQMPVFYNYLGLPHSLMVFIQFLTLAIILTIPIGGIIALIYGLVSGKGCRWLFTSSESMRLEQNSNIQGIPMQSVGAPYGRGGYVIAPPPSAPSEPPYAPIDKEGPPPAYPSLKELEKTPLS